MSEAAAELGISPDNVPATLDVIYNTFVADMAPLTEAIYSWSVDTINIIGGAVAEFGRRAQSVMDANHLA